jgi:hypothetical protein
VWRKVIGGNRYKDGVFNGSQMEFSVLFLFSRKKFHHEKTKLTAPIGGVAIGNSFFLSLALVKIVIFALISL